MKKPPEGRCQERWKNEGRLIYDKFQIAGDAG